MTSEPENREDASRGLSRRNFFKGVGVAGAAAAAPQLGRTAPAAAADANAHQLEALETLTASEHDTLEAICARLIPTDENGPGAKEAHAAHYIDRSLAGAYAAQRNAYYDGLAAVNAYAVEKKGAEFAKLAAKDQDEILTALQRNEATGFKPNSAAFFNLVRTHTIQGTFCDPYYGGNANFVGWDLIGYPGIREAVTEDEQRLRKPEAVRASAYASALFAKQGGGHGHNP